MTILLSTATSTIWQEAVKTAESACLVTLDDRVESYLVSLLNRYVNRPDIVKQVFAKAYLEALERQAMERSLSLQQVGDQCLLFAGLFPKQAQRKHVKINYFVDVGRAAYNSISKNEFFSSLAMQFVLLMDILQSIRGETDLLPLEAYEQWTELGSQRAFRILQSYLNLP